MRRAFCSRWLNPALSIVEHPRGVEPPLFLCPSIHTSLRRLRLEVAAFPSPAPASPWTPQRQFLHLAHPKAEADVQIPPPSVRGAPQPLPTRKLPRQCRGCGALTQTSRPGQPGYFDLGRKAVQNFLGIALAEKRSRAEDKIYEEALMRLDHEQLEKQGVDVEGLLLSLESSRAPKPVPTKVPLCDRCHDLYHNHSGKSISHPSVDAIRDTILESPWKHNHVYHVLDAADFPMSLLPQLSHLLDTMPLRSQNRRSRHVRYYHGRKTELSFIITRCDLLAPQPKQVEKIFPLMQELLRDALGKTGQNVRLGNVALVSSKRAWRTKELKEDIWNRAGATWMVGKVNVGKSQLIEQILPKGRMDWPPPRDQIRIHMQSSSTRGQRTEATDEASENAELTPEETETGVIEEVKEGEIDTYALLPPPPKEVNYPEMPLVSDLPGTTASPIRIPFGNGLGELIDLPGLERSGLEKYVKEEHRPSLVMRSRIVPEQMTLKPGQSLLLGGFIRITPRDPKLIMLTYAFTPIKPHVTRTDKAIQIQMQTDSINIENIAEPGTGEKTKLAGSFELRWDVTKKRTGPLTRKHDVGLKVEQLPYRVLSADILIEGVGWVEITAQVRTKALFGEKPKSEPGGGELAQEPGGKTGLSPLERLELAGTWTGEPSRSREKMPARGSDEWTQAEDKGEQEFNWPILDVYSPEGKFISVRPPLNLWLMNKPKGTTKSRPRRSMKGMKKLEKRRKREREASAGGSANP
ncbi:hypothetical protein GGS23DRAFT_563457 [Durotheca rogersii]|uniref:uncharacterized protein n=1 Tax=Durotheca rogersii TaxID=419775 RepID=UPI002220D94C|nr:uncharacterized protein GGS23DRAFT_563457 [Durotheca rogersii]KAI5864235.1 hypothetical protein GGS23DRAFT_563457 [Durotheca rogersii]